MKTSKVHLWSVNIRVEDCDEIDKDGLMADLKNLSKNFDWDEDGYEYWCDVYGDIYYYPQTLECPEEYEEDLEFDEDMLSAVLSDYSKEYKVFWDRPEME